ncbi:39S ribosomal protein L38, mitochondrial [Pectinophora gossypiella]|uniref:39S ribosomal protein L38, mitochondrial n=1 Tax=Pectinophora gossypiella TaxID=13191 RepID=UPI00214EC785|nr:39S ribosomal protein L38, mitochondrial [Pectinophora gossypiella]
MLKTLRGACITSVQFQQIRLGHRVRGKAPIYCRTIKERLDELNYKDELHTTRIDIGFRRPNSENLRNTRMEHVKKLKNDKNLEQLARTHKLEIDLAEVRKEWMNTTGPLHRRQIADHYGIYEHLYGEGFFIPYLNLDVFYDLKNDSVLPVCSGNVIKPAEALEQPTVAYESDGNTLWTLAFTNLDGNLKENNKEYVHWLVANIPGNAIEKGDTIAEYLRPFPLKGTGYHRYVYVLYKQNARVSYDLPKVTASSPLDDRTFVTREWYKNHQDEITPIGLAFFQCDWDHTVKDFFHNVLQTKEPVYEYDFPAPYIRPQEWFPRRKPFNLYMDKYRDPKQINKEYLLRKLKDEDPFKTPPPPLRFPNAHPLPKSMPSWLKLHERKIRLRWGRVNDV